jgi:hypothetical protein
MTSRAALGHNKQGYILVLNAREITLHRRTSETSKVVQHSEVYRFRKGALHQHRLVLSRKEVAEGTDTTSSTSALLEKFLLPFACLHSNIIMATNEAANDEEWAQAEGVPSLSDPFIQKYLQGRDALVQQEKRQRSGW